MNPIDNGVEKYSKIETQYDDNETEEYVID